MRIFWVGFMIDIKWDVGNVLFCVRIMDGFVFGFICDLFG